MSPRGYENIGALTAASRACLLIALYAVGFAVFMIVIRVRNRRAIDRGLARAGLLRRSP